MAESMKARSMKHSADITRNEPRKRRRRQIRITDIFGLHSTMPYNCSFSSGQAGFGGDSGSFTFRLAHQESGYAARTLGEEKILIFRSDRPGAIAKIVFSSWTPHCFSHAEHTVEGKINYLHVKEEYRGYDFGGLLFLEALASFRSRYGKNYEFSEKEDSMHHESSFPSSSLSTVIKCHIDAEEDDNRHNKLVRFYERLGCSVKPSAKIQYINGSDGRTYRKVPMQITFKGQDCMSNSLSKSDTLLPFLPIVLRFNERQRVSVKATRDPIRWLLVEDARGDLQLRTTSGFCLTSKEEEEKTFREELSLERSDLVAESQSKLVFECDTLGNFATQPLNWMVRFVSTGLYLSVDTANGNLACSKEPTCWRTGEQDLSLTWMGNYHHEPVLVDSDSESRGPGSGMATLSQV